MYTIGRIALFNKKIVLHKHKTQQLEENWAGLCQNQNVFSSSVVILEVVMDLGHSDLFTWVGYSFVWKNFNNNNQMPVRKNFSRAIKWDQPRFCIFFCVEVTTFPRHTTVWWLLDFSLWLAVDS